MLSFEKVLQIFKEYLDEDLALEIYESRYGYISVFFDGIPPRSSNCEGKLCRTPEELFDHLLSEYESYVSVLLTQGRREENETDKAQIQRLCRKFLDQREERKK